MSQWGLDPPTDHGRNYLLVCGGRGLVGGVRDVLEGVGVLLGGVETTLSDIEHNRLGILALNKHVD